MVSRSTQLFGLVFLLFHAPGLAAAQETVADPPPGSSDGFYWSLDLSAGKPNDPQAPGVYEADLGMEFGSRFGVGYAYHWLRAEAQIGYEAFGLNGVGPLPDSPLAGTDSTKGDISGLVMMGNLFVDLGASAGPRWFLGAGYGFARLEADYYGEVCWLLVCSEGDQIVDGTDSVAAWQGMAGLSIPFRGGGGALFIGYRYFATADIGLNVVGVGPVTQEGVQSHSVMLGFRVRLRAN